MCTGHMSTTLNPKSNMVLDSSCALWQIDNEPDLAVRAGTCGQDQNDWCGFSSNHHYMIIVSCAKS